MAAFMKKILWPTDFSREAVEALVYADLFARRFSSKITALHVVPDFAPVLYESSPVIQEKLLQRMISMKKGAQRKIQAIGEKKGVSFSRIIIAEGSAAKKIVDTAEKEKAGLIVMGKRGQSMWEKLVIGSVANHVLRHSPVPILLTRKRKKKLGIKKILVPTDFTKGEEVEREYALKLAKGFNASLTLLYILELFGHEFRMVDEMFGSVLEKFRKKVRREKKDIDVEEEIIHAVNAAAGISDFARARRFDLIVMATCSAGIGRFVLGSTTEKVLSRTDIPLFAIPPKFC